jgi:nucleotide-binding universal stress UspA family protein
MNSPPHVLIAIDGSETALRAVRHVAEMLCAARPTRVTLLHVAGIAPELLEHPGGRDDAEEEALERGVADNVRAASTDVAARAERSVFGPARAVIDELQSHPDESRIDVKLIAEAHADPATAVIEEAETGRYDAIVLGRRGQGRLADLLLGSVATRVVKKVTNCAVWVVE